MEGLAAAYRDRFSLQVRWQGAGLEQTGAAGGPLARGSSESVAVGAAHRLAGAWQLERKSPGRRRCSGDWSQAGVIGGVSAASRSRGRTPE